MPLSASIEFAPQFGFLDSAPFASASSLDAHFLRTIATNANHMVTQRQPVYRGLWSTTSGSFSQTMGGLSTFLYGQWRTVQPPTIIQKQPWVTELEVFIRLFVTSGSVIELQPVTLASPFDSAGVLVVTGTAPGASPGTFQLVSGTVPCRPGSEEVFSLMVRGFMDPSRDALFNRDVASTYRDGTVSSSFDLGNDRSPGRFMPISGTTNFAATDTPNFGAYVTFHSTGTLDMLSGPHVIVSSSVAPSTIDYGRRSLYFLPPAERDLKGARYRLHQAPLAQFASVVAYTKPTVLTGSN